ncbi:MAG: APC family permease [Synechococcus sp.]
MLDRWLAGGSEKQNGSPRETLSLLDAIAITVGIVVGVGIFRTPSIVAANTETAAGFLSIWVLGGAISLIGALCYSELASTYPHSGGEYRYLSSAYGKDVGWLFGWARLTVIQTGSIAILAFVLGDYSTQLFPLGPYSSSIYATGAIVLLTILNGVGIEHSKGTQKLLTAAKILGLLLVVFTGLVFGSASHAEASAVSAASSSKPSYGLAAIFVLLTYGGWNEVAYLSAELCDPKRNTVSTSIWSIGIVTTIFLLANLAYLKGMGLAAIAQSDAVAAELMRQVAGQTGARFVSVLVVVSVLGAMHGTILTGARSIYAVGQDFSAFSILGRWHVTKQTPIPALVVQGLLALLLVLLGTLTRTGFETTVEFTAPVFWFFLFLTGLSLFVLRWRDPELPRPFRVPLYPLVPLLFCLTNAYMLQASLAYTGWGALVGMVVLAIGLPVLLVARWVEGTTQTSD